MNPIYNHTNMKENRRSSTLFLKYKCNLIIKIIVSKTYFLPVYKKEETIGSVSLEYEYKSTGRETPYFKT